MINSFFNNARQAGVGASTFSAAEQTLHSIHQVMTVDPFFTHVVHYHVVPHYITQQHVIYPTDLSTIPFGSIYYL